MHKTAGVPDQQCKNTSALAGAKFKPEVLAYNNAYCSWLFQAMLGCLSFGTPPYGGSKVPCRFSVIGHPLEVPFQALQGYLMTRVAGSFRYQMARGLWPGATA